MNLYEAYKYMNGIAEAEDELRDQAKGVNEDDYQIHDKYAKRSRQFANWFRELEWRRSAMNEIYTAIETPATIKVCMREEMQNNAN